MHTVTVISNKGGSGKTLKSAGIAATLKVLCPWLKVGLIDGATDQGGLSGEYAPGKEEAQLGVWRVLHSMLDPITRKDPTQRKAAINQSVTPIQVIPGNADGVVELLNCGKEIGKAVRSYGEMGRSDVSEILGKPLLESIASERGWDICVVDLPGTTQDVFSMLTIPNGMPSIIPVDCRLPMNLHGLPDLIGILQASQGSVLGLWENMTEETSACRETRRSLNEEIVPGFGTPVVASLPYRASLAKAVLVTQAMREAGGLLPMGFHMLRENRLEITNQSQQRIVDEAIGVFETMANRILAEAGLLKEVTNG